MAGRRYKKEHIQAVESYHKQILQRLKTDEDVCIHQGSYKSLYFEIFQEAYESGFCHQLSYNLRYEGEYVFYDWIFARPLVTGDSIWDYAKKQGWVYSEMKGDEKRYKQIETVRTWWDEWTYAWIHLMHKTRRYRTIEKPSTNKPPTA
ncbi:MAG: hypothetical protein ABFC96_04220 [Thermoguttaceae bacterium]